MEKKINTGERRDGERISGYKWLNCWIFEDEVRNYGECNRNDKRFDTKSDGLKK